MKRIRGIRRVGTGIVVAVLCLPFVLLGLSACERYEPESNERQAMAYYQQKYGKRLAVRESNRLGDYGLFGFSYSGMEYIMDDGASVVYYDGEGVFRDNAQSEQIKEAAEEYARSRLDMIPGALTPVDVQSVGQEVYYETYKGEGVCWHTRFDGNIRSFLKKERPTLWLESYYSGSDSYGGSFLYHMAYDASVAQEVEDAYLALGTYFDLGAVTLAMVDAESYEALADPLTLTIFDDVLVYKVDFSESAAGEVKALHFKPEFVDLAEGVRISSNTAGFSLAQGDVALERQKDGFWKVALSSKVKEAEAELGGIGYYVFNDGGQSLLRMQGIDRFTTLCEPYQKSYYISLSDGDILYLGDPTDVWPSLELVDVSSSRVRVRYHTHFKDAVHKLDLAVYGMAYGGQSYAQSTKFDSRIVEETDDGWVFEVDVPSDAVPSNTLHFQLSYNGSETITVQLEQEVELPL